MAGILKVKDGNAWVDIPAIIGPQGPQGPKGDPGDVQSVSGKTGAVTLDAGDVAFDDQQAYNDGTVGAGLTNLKSQITGKVNVAQGVENVGKALVVGADGNVVPGDMSGGDVTTEQWLYSFPTDTASGAVASFSDGGDNLPVKDLTIGIEPAQSGSGDPSPDNVRPISGWTGANINANGTTIPITFSSEAGTVYGGTLDVTTGVLTVDRVEVDLGEFEWNYLSSYSVFTALLSYPSQNARCICSHYTYNGLSVGSSRPDKTVNTGLTYFTVDKKTVSVKDTSYTSANDFKTAMSGVKLVYPIVTSQTYQLTPVEVLTLLGANTIYADTGDTTVTYRADPTLYIQRINTPTDDDMTADAQIASGKYFVIGNTLYKATTIIPAGDTITPGTNCVITNLAEALNALNA